MDILNRRYKVSFDTLRSQALSGLQENKSSSRGCSGFEKEHYFMLWFLSRFLAHHINMNTVKPVLSGHSKRRLKIGFQDR